MVDSIVETTRIANKIEINTEYGDTPALPSHQQRRHKSPQLYRYPGVPPSGPNAFPRSIWAPLASRGQSSSRAGYSLCIFTGTYKPNQLANISTEREIRKWESSL